jgi:rubrerythrin
MQIDKDTLARIIALQNQANSARSRLQAAVSSLDAACTDAMASCSVAATDHVLCTACGAVFKKRPDGDLTCPVCNPPDEVADDPVQSDMD